MYLLFRTGRTQTKMYYMKYKHIWEEFMQSRSALHDFKNYRKPFFHAVIFLVRMENLLCKLESWSRSAEDKHVRLGSGEKGWDTL